MTTWAVLASGPSMSQELADFVRGKCSVVAISDCYRLAPWANALVSNDANWWRQHPDARKFAGRKFAGTNVVGVERISADGNYGGGSNSGLQGMRVAAMLGAERIILLGFDMCSAKGAHYFGAHPHPLKNTTANRFKTHIRQFDRWRGCPVINCTPGSALKKFPMSTIEKELGAMRIAQEVCLGSQLISSKHQKLYQDYYAARSIKIQPSRWMHRVDAMAQQVGAKSILDYGCGAGRGISSFSRYAVADYDPGVPGCTGEPMPADLVVSIHALEHVEPEYVDAVIEHMTKLATKALFIVVSCEPSTKLLPDGSAWHSFVRSAEWWRNKLSAFDSQPVLMDRHDAEYAAMLVTDHAERYEERSAIAI